MNIAITQVMSLLGLVSGMAWGQEFEIASIKPNVANDRIVRIGVGPGGDFNARGYSLKLLIQRAYGIKGFQVSGGPSWLDVDRWDVVARPPREVAENPKPGLMDAMLRALLAERFSLKAHMTTRVMPGFFLTAIDGRTKLKVSSASEEKMWREGSEVVVEGANPASLAIMLGSYLGRPVHDRTGLKGRYDFRLHWTVRADAVSLTAPDDESSSLTLPRAVTEQLGLRLIGGKVPAEILVIDAAQRPSAN